jgi:hypothetical protein
LAAKEKLIGKHVVASEDINASQPFIAAILACQDIEMAFLFCTSCSLVWHPHFDPLQG